MVEESAPIYERSYSVDEVKVWGMSAVSSRMPGRMAQRVQSQVPVVAALHRDGGHAVPSSQRRQEMGTRYIEPDSAWENGYLESFKGKRREELLDQETVDTLLEAKVPVARWGRHYHSLSIPDEGLLSFQEAA